MTFGQVRAATATVSSAKAIATGIWMKNVIKGSGIVNTMMVMKRLMTARIGEDYHQS